MEISLETFFELLAGAVAASSHASALGMKFPAEDPKDLAAAAYATGRTRIAYEGEHPVAKVSTMHTAIDWTLVDLLAMVLSELWLSCSKGDDRERVADGQRVTLVCLGPGPKVWSLSEGWTGSFHWRWIVLRCLEE